MPSSGSLVSTSVYQVWSAAPDEDDKSVSHLLERIWVATVKKKIVYGVEIETLLYFRVGGK